LGLCLLLLGPIAFVHLPKAASQSNIEEASKPPSKLNYYLLLSSSIISCLVGVIYLITMNISYKVTNDINAKVFKIEGMSLSIIAFSAFLIVATSTALSTVDQVGDSLDAGVCTFKALCILGIIGIVVGFVHLVIVYFEQRTLIKATVGVMLLLAAVLAVMSGIVIYRSIKNMKVDNCDGDIIASLHKNYLTELGCPDKYNTRSTNLKDLNCSKDDIKFIWEENFAHPVTMDDIDDYGCINHDCCSKAMTALKIVFYSVGFGGLILALALLLTTRKAYTFQESEMKVERGHLKADILLREGHLPLFLVAIVVLILILVFGSKFRLSNPPKVEDYMKVDVLPGGVDKDDLGKFKEYVSPSYVKKYYPLTTYVISEQSANCEPDCDSFIYHVEVTGPPESEVILDPKAYSNKKVIIDKDAMSEAEGNLVKFKCKYEEINKILSMIQYRPGELTRANKVTLDVKARYESDFDLELKQYREDNRRRRLDNDFYPGQNPFYPIIKRDITFEFFQNAVNTNYKGSIYSKAEGKEGHEPVPGVKIEGRSLQFENRVICEGSTNDEGNFELSLPILRDRENNEEILPYMAVLELRKEGYLPKTAQVTVGGHGLITEYKLGSFLMIPERTSKEPLNVTVLVFDAEEEEPIKGAEVKLEDTKLSSDKEGRVEYEEPIHCGKEIEVTKKGYYPYEENLYCEEGDQVVNVSIPLVPVIDDYRLRVVLTWTGPNKDLDLHVKFIKSSEIECKVDFALMRCGGAVLQGDSLRNESDSLPATEILDLNTIGPYQYIFFVDDFLSKDIASLEGSDAYIEVYSGLEENGPIVTLEIPQDQPQVVFRVRSRRI